MAESVAKGKSCSGPEEFFCRLIAYEGKSQSAAYRLAWKTTANTARVMAVRVMARPHVAARIAEMRAAADREGQMQMAERRRLLAETARAVPRKAIATHADRIAAIREDAVLAGERRNDGTQLTIGGDLNLSVVLASLRGNGSAAVPLTEAWPVVEVVAAADGAAEVASSAPVLRERQGERGEAVVTVSKPVGAMRGPLGRVRGAGPVIQPAVPVARSNAGGIDAGTFLADE